MEKVYTSPLKNYLTSNGFIPVSNLLIDYQEQLGISEGELIFLIKIMRHKNGYIIHDKDLDSSLSSKTLSRRRNSLKEKGYLNFTIIKKQDETGVFATQGISYDLSQLEEKLQLISNSLYDKKQEKIEEKLTEEKCISEKTYDTPLNNYKNDYKKYYGVEYNFSDYELKKYNELSEQNKIIISYIFKFCSENNLLTKIVPRLSLFFKTPFRFIELKNYCIENGYISEEVFVPTVEEKEVIDLTNLNDELYYKYYNDKKQNIIFYKAIERYTNKYFDRKTKTMPDITILLNSTYEKNRKYETIDKLNQ